MLTNEQVERAIGFARLCHHGQVDKVGMPFFLHPMRVMAGVAISANFRDMGEERWKILIVTAILHDVVEDCDVPLSYVEMEWGLDVRDAVDALSRRDKESYPDYIDRCMENPIAKHIKRVDVADNLSRLLMVEDEDTQKRLHAKYLGALEKLTNYVPGVDGSLSGAV